jgi:hypothetical protein
VPPAAEHELLIVLAIEDITERTRTEDLRREGQMRLRHAADAAGLTYVEVNLARARWRARRWALRIMILGSLSLKAWRTS